MSAQQPSKFPVQLTLDLNLPPALGAEDFIVTSSNRDAYSWLSRWPNWPNRALAIYGGEGSGKTHLGHIWQGRSGATFLSPQEFDALDLSVFEALHVVIDQACEITQEEKLFHLYNRVNSTQGSLLLLAKVPPARWNVRLPDLRSRLNAVACVEVLPPDDALLEGVILKLLADHQLVVELSAVQFLMKNIERSFESLQEWVKKLNARSLQEKRPITIPFIKQMMSED